MLCSSLKRAKWDGVIDPSILNPNEVNENKIISIEHKLASSNVVSNANVTVIKFDEVSNRIHMNEFNIFTQLSEDLDDYLRSSTLNPMVYHVQQSLGHLNILAEEEDKVKPETDIQERCRQHGTLRIRN